MLHASIITEDENNNVDGCSESKCDESGYGLEITTINNEPQVDSNAEEEENTTLCYERLVEVFAAERRQLNAEIASLRLKVNQLEAELQLAGVLNRNCAMATPSNKQQEMSEICESWSNRQHRVETENAEIAHELSNLIYNFLVQTVYLSSHGRTVELPKAL